MKVFLTSLILSASIAFSCNNINNKIKVKEVEISDKVYNRDGVFIEYTIHQFINQKYRGYDFYDSLNSKVYIDTILYSPDKLKMFSLVVIEKTKIEHGKPFHGMAVVAYRGDTNNIWKVYPITTLNVSWSNLKGAKNVIRRLYFKELKGMVDNQKNEFKYNLGEEDFWEDLYFKKGFDVDSLYYFQTELNKQTPTLMRKKDAIIPYLEIDYPREMVCN